MINIYYGGHNAYKSYKYGGRPAPDGASPTQPYKCGLNVKVKIPNRSDFDFDFKILTAFIRLGRAGPVGAGCPP